MTKIHIFLDRPEQIELTNKRLIEIRPSKHERLFQSFENSENIARQFIDVASRDPTIRQFLFLKSYPQQSLETPTKYSVTYPFCLNPNYDIVEKMSKKSYEHKKEMLEDRISMLTPDYAFSLERFFMKMTSYYTENISQEERPQLIIEQLKNDLSIDNKQAANFYQILYDLILKYKTFFELYRFLNYAEKISKIAVLNSKTVSQTLPLPDSSQQILDSLSLLCKFFTVRTESLCLECYFRFNDYPPFFTETSTMRTIDLNTECQRCHQKGLIHQISWDYLESISKLVMPDSNWLFEIIIGFAMEDYDFIKEIYIHKMLGVKGPKQNSYIESDIIIITKDNQLILAEVTTQSDISNLTNNITSKGLCLQRSKIPYYKLMYFTSTDSNNYYEVKKFKTRIFGIKHLYNMEHFIRSFVKR